MDTLFSVMTPLGFTIRTTMTYWQYVVRIKHPCMTGKEEVVKEVLKNPQKICQSSMDKTVYLYYGKMERLYCVVAKHTISKEGFLSRLIPLIKSRKGKRYGQGDCVLS